MRWPGRVGAPGGPSQVITSTVRRRGHHRGVHLRQLASSGERSGPVEGEAAERLVGLIHDRPVGGDVTGRPQGRVVGEVLSLDPLDGFLVVGGCVPRAAKQYQFEGFQFHGHSPGKVVVTEVADTAFQ
jgi:hypothetical protein